MKRPIFNSKGVTLAEITIASFLIVVIVTSFVMAYGFIRTWSLDLSHRTTALHLCRQIAEEIMATEYGEVTSASYPGITSPDGRTFSRNVTVSPETLESSAQVNRKNVSIVVSWDGSGNPSSESLFMIVGEK